MTNQLPDPELQGAVHLEKVGPEGLEPSTRGLKVRCSNSSIQNTFYSLYRLNVGREESMCWKQFEFH